MATKTKKPARQKAGKHPGGRPSEFDEAKNQEVFKRIIEGGPDASLRSILKDMNYVHIATFLRWAVDPDPIYDQFREQYRLFREVWGESMAHKAVEIVQKSVMVDVKITRKDGSLLETKQGDPVLLGQHRLEAEHYRWFTGRILGPFRAKQEVTHDVSEKLSDLLKKADELEKGNEG